MVVHCVVVHHFACTDSEGGGGPRVRTPAPENHKNIGFLSNIGPEPL